MVGRMLFALALTLASAGAAQATATLDCSAKDTAIDFSATAVVPHSRHAPIMQFQADLQVLLQDVPDTLKGLKLENMHLTHHWLHERDLKLLLFWEQEAAPSVAVKLVIDTRSDTSADIGSTGTYRLTVIIPDSTKPERERQVTAEGSVSCSVG